MNYNDLISELKFKAIRSSGPGGQHVNKVSSKIELQFDLEGSQLLDEAQKNILYKKLTSRLTTKGILILYCDETRSQHRNKELAIQRFIELIKDSLKKPKKRKPTKISKAVKIKRQKAKQKHSQKKIQRKKPDLDS